VNISLKRALKLRKESDLTIGKSLALIPKATSTAHPEQRPGERHWSSFMRVHCSFHAATACRPRAVPETRHMQFAAIASDKSFGLRRDGGGRT
jgi:hypothetical protein